MIKRTKVLICFFAILLTVLAILTAIFVVRFLGSPSWNMARGERYLTEAEYKKAVTCYNRVLKHDKNNLKAYLGLADAYQGLEDQDAAIVILEDAVSIIKNEPLDDMSTKDEEEVYIVLSELYEKNNKSEDAYELLSEGKVLLDSDEIADILKDKYSPVDASAPSGDNKNIQANTESLIKALVINYYSAKINCDLEKMKELVSNPETVSEEKLKSGTEYVENYYNIITYIYDGMEEGTYIVYVYQEIKFTGIDTPAPGLTKFYLITGADGRVRIYTDTMEGKLKSFYDAKDNDKEIQDLIEMTDYNVQKALSHDKKLKDLFDLINQ